MISKEEILALAELARLELKEGEAEGLQKDISSILDYVGQLSSYQAAQKELRTSVPSGHAASEELRSVLPTRNVTRADAPREASDPLFGKEEALRAAFPKREGDYNVVRKIIQKDE